MSDKNTTKGGRRHTAGAFDIRVFIGALLASKVGKRDTDIEYAGIASLARGKYALNKKILDIAMTDGSAHRISIDKFDEFVDKLTATTGKSVAPLAE